MGGCEHNANILCFVTLPPSYHWPLPSLCLGVKKVEVEKPFAPFPAPFILHFPGLSVAFHSAPLQPVAQHGEPPPSPAASPTAQVGPGPSLTLAFGFPPSSLNDASATCGPIIRAPEEGIRGRNRRRAEMIKWKGGR